jgi:hypothetical protein
MISELQHIADRPRTVDAEKGDMVLGEETKCDRVKICRSDGYRTLELSSVCDCIVEEDGESSRHDHSRE